MFSVERKNKGTVSKSFRLQSKRKRQKERRRERESEILHVCSKIYASVERKKKRGEERERINVA